MESSLSMPHSIFWNGLLGLRCHFQDGSFITMTGKLMPVAVWKLLVTETPVLFHVASRLGTPHNWWLVGSVRECHNSEHSQRTDLMC